MEKAGEAGGEIAKAAFVPKELQRREIYGLSGGCAAAGRDLKDLQHAAPCRQAGAGAVQGSACSELTLQGCRGELQSAAELGGKGEELQDTRLHDSSSGQLRVLPGK